MAKFDDLSHRFQLTLKNIILITIFRISGAVRCAAATFDWEDDNIRFSQICDACLKKMVLLWSGEVTEEVMFHPI